MADIKIKHTRTIPLNSEETTIEVTGVEYGADTLTKSISEALGAKKTRRRLGNCLSRERTARNSFYRCSPRPRPAISECM